MNSQKHRNLREASDAIAVRRVNSDAAFRTTFSRVWRFTLFAFASILFTWLKYACVSPILTSEGRKWGVRSVVVEFGVFGAPRFSVQKSPNPLKIGVWGPLD